MPGPDLGAIGGSGHVVGEGVENLHRVLGDPNVLREVELDADVAIGEHGRGPLIAGVLLDDTNRQGRVGSHEVIGSGGAHHPAPHDQDVIRHGPRLKRAHVVRVGADVTSARGIRLGSRGLSRFLVLGSGRGRAHVAGPSGGDDGSSNWRPGRGLLVYRDTVLEAASELEAPVVVGHSMAGAVIPLVAESRAVSSLVFLSGFLPSAGSSLNELRAAEPLEKYRLSTVEFEDLGDQVWMVGLATARELFFHDVPEDLASWAEKLLRPQCYRVFDEASPLNAWPDVHSAYVLCTEDRALNPDWSRSAAQDRLGVIAIELGGGHSPFLSRPAELARALEAAAAS